MFHAVIRGHALDDEGERILDCMEEAHDWLSSAPRKGSWRKYDCGRRFANGDEAAAWFEHQAVKCGAEALRHVEFAPP